MTYPVFFQLVSVHAKTLDQQEQSSSEAKCNANQTQRQQQPQKSNKKDKKQIPANEKIIWKNNLFVKPKGKFKKLSEEEQKALIRKAIDWSKKSVIEKAIQIEVILVIMIKYERKSQPLLNMSNLHTKWPLLLVVLYQRIKIINKLRTLYL